jgi:hypothetical protein
MLKDLDKTKVLKVTQEQYNRILESNIDSVTTLNFVV